MIIGSVENNEEELPQVAELPVCQVSQRLDSLMNELYALRDEMHKLVRELQRALNR